RRVRSASSASSASRRAPLVATITGSTTTCAGRCRCSARATVSITGALASMPSLTAPIRKSSKQASICASRNSSGGTCTAVTPRVGGAVSAASADSPCTPWAAKVLRSAWMPAPPPESEPAMVSTLTGLASWIVLMRSFCRVRKARGQFQRVVEGGRKAHVRVGGAETHVTQHPARLRLHAGQHQGDPQTRAALGEVVQCVGAGGVDDGHEAHAQDQHLRRCVDELVQQMIQAIAGAEEQRAVDAEGLHAGGQPQALGTVLG